MHALLRQATILSLALSLPVRSHPNWNDKELSNLRTKQQTRACNEVTFVCCKGQPEP